MANRHGAMQCADAIVDTATACYIDERELLGLFGFRQIKAADILGAANIQLVSRNEVELAMLAINPHSQPRDDLASAIAGNLEHGKQKTRDLLDV
ncbi:uncharacterized protein ANIA_11488 [Aspergillus nidulans FGSC A4]|uniref:Uncharacterized protein n=1 Tax=Emericella nidulans (strain FGSC A4 / ATCC 38163 / CBS 112.46 / NRRL 194 / M139) TaxID=227321 RepID=C8VFT6_EMENI|nr:hypothetical protein [Aspergillus nidulans FGSC A4]CBF81459.1 TPA: hypothetical protein ANIA_11488 [Aspergillus nidulans FGSC A4]